MALTLFVSVKTEAEELYIASRYRLLQFDGVTGSYLGTVPTPNGFSGSSLVAGPNGFLFGEGNSGLWRINPETSSA